MRNLTTLTLLAVSASLPAQCLFTTVTTQSIGPSCNFASTGFCAIVATPTTLTSVLDATNCRLEIHVDSFQGCGAAIPLRALVLGTQQVFVPLPEFGSTCALHVLPVVMLVSTTSLPFVLNLPPNVPALSFLAQGGALSLPPFATEGFMTFSEGQAISLQ